MFKSHKNICASCGQNTLIVVKKMLCGRCNHKLKQEAKKASGKKVSKSFVSYSYKESTGEAEVFLSVWGNSNQRCFVCNKPILYPIASNFMHVLAKAPNKFPKYRLYEPNIVLGCHDSETSCHHRYDHMPLSTLVEPIWNPLFNLRDKLKAQYPEIK